MPAGKMSNWIPATRVFHIPTISFESEAAIAPSQNINAAIPSNVSNDLITNGRHTIAIPCFIFLNDCVLWK